MARPANAAPGGAITQEALPGLSVRLHKSVEEFATTDGAVLRAVRKRPLERARGAVVCFHGFGQNRYSFHLPGFSLTTWLTGHGFETWNVDLRGHGRSRASAPPPLNCDDYLQRDFPAAMAHVAAATGGPAFAMGHSLGGAVLYGGTPYARDAVAGIIPLSAVYAFGGRQPLFRWAGRVSGMLPHPEAVDRLHIPIDWIGRGMSGALAVVDSPLGAVSPFTIWHPKTIHRTRLAYRVSQGFDRTSIGVARQLLWWAGTGRFTSADGAVDYAARWRRDGDVPLLVIGGDRDTLLPPSDAKQGYAESPSADKTFRVFGRQDGGRPWGHVDLIQGDRAPRFVWPEILEWLETRSEPAR